MAIKKVEIQDHLGNVYYPHTEANVVFTKDGKTVEEKIEDLKLSANNGKNIVANAIGSPLLATDNFSEMGNKIDTLTSQFKTNLRNKGVDVSGLNKMGELIKEVETVQTIPYYLDLPYKKSEHLSIVSNFKLEEKLTNALCYTKNNKVFYFGGYRRVSDSQVITNTNEYGIDLSTFEYTPKKNSTSIKGEDYFPVKTELKENDSFAIYVNKYYKNLIFYDVNLKTYTSSSTPYDIRSFMEADNFIYFLGGAQNGSWISDVYKYDINTRTYTIVAQNNVSGSQSQPIVVRYKNELHIFSIKAIDKSMQKFDIITNTFTTVVGSGSFANMDKYFGFECIMIDNKAHIINGGLLINYDCQTHTFSNEGINPYMSGSFTFKNGYTFACCGGELVTRAESNDNIILRCIKK